MPRYSAPRHHKLRRRPRAGSIPVAGRPNAPTDIPACWFSQPLQLRLDRPINHAEVAQADGITARVDNTASIATNRGVFPFTATLSTAVDADATNLAHWTVTYNGTARMRSPLLALNLLPRTDAEKLLILGVTRGERIRITDLPVEWPASAKTLVIAGITHRASVFGRVVEWTTAPVIGSVDGIPGPWFRWGTSSWGGTDIRPF